MRSSGVRRTTRVRDVDWADSTRRAGSYPSQACCVGRRSGGRPSRAAPAARSAELDDVLNYVPAAEPAGGLPFGSQLGRMRTEGRIPDFRVEQIQVVVGP